MYYTRNDSTVSFNQCTVTVIDYSSYVNEDREQFPIVTWELVYPRYIHSELMTHRVFSRNAGSSRATPLKVSLAEVRTHPAFFSRVGFNEPGMVSRTDLDSETIEEFKKDWVTLANTVADTVEAMEEKYGIHKQILNRALEPFSFIRTLVTTTDTDNFFKLRLAKDAQPEMQDLAKAMLMSLTLASTPYTPKAYIKGIFSHVPYETENSSLLSLERIIHAIANCARVSYMRHEGKVSSLEADTKLATQLLQKGHMSPFEHIAFAHQGKFANFNGWISLRHVLEQNRDLWEPENCNIEDVIKALNSKFNFF